MTHCDCGRFWAGLAEAHCTACHAHFGTVRAFDEHQRGPRCSVTVVNGPDHRHAGRPVLRADQTPNGVTYRRTNYDPTPEFWT